MKRLILTISATVILMLSACGNPDRLYDNTSPTASVPGTEAPVQNVAAPATKSYNIVALAPKSYNLRDSAIYKENKEAVYDASLYYDESWTAWVDNITEAYGALYFTEGAVVNDGISCICDAALKGAAYAVVSTDLDGKNRRVLVSKTTPNGYSDLLPFADRIFYVDLSLETASVGYVGKDGGDAAVLILPAGTDEVCVNAKLDTDGNFIIIEAEYASNGSDAISLHTYRVDSALNLERIN